MRPAALLLFAVAACPACAQAPLLPLASSLPAPFAPGVVSQGTIAAPLIPPAPLALIPPAARALPALIPPASPAPPALTPPAPDAPLTVALPALAGLPPPVSLPTPGLPDLPLAAPPGLPVAPRVVRVRVRVPAPERFPKPPVVAVVPQARERLVVYGRSAQGRALRAFVLDSGLPSAGRVTLIFGGFHGNERSTPGVVERLHLFLLQTPTVWLNQRVVLVPEANPDGVALGTRDNARGVDINRNFPAGWEAAARAARYSPGPRAASEPETQAIIALIARFRPAKIVSLHSPLRCLNWTGDLGRAMALAMHASDHLPVTATVGYPTPGSLGDYCGAHGIGIVTLELPHQSADAAWAANRGALVRVIALRPAGE